MYAAAGRCAIGLYKKSGARATWMRVYACGTESESVFAHAVCAPGWVQAQQGVRQGGGRCPRPPPRPAFHRRVAAGGQPCGWGATSGGVAGRGAGAPCSCERQINPRQRKARGPANPTLGAPLCSSAADGLNKTRLPSPALTEPAARQAARHAHARRRKHVGLGPLCCKIWRGLGLQAAQCLASCCFSLSYW